MKLICLKKELFHVSDDTINEFEQVILQDSIVTNIKPISDKQYLIKFFIYRLLRKTFSYTSRRTIKKYIIDPLGDKKHIFTVMMGFVEESKFKPYGLFTNHNRSIFLFDAWPHDFEKIIDFVDKFKIDYIFVSASQSAFILNNKSNKNCYYWISEGINPIEYKQNIQLADKTIDVLALGRKYDRYHQLIVDEINTKKITYLYEKQKGELIFPTRVEFVEGLAKSKISICVPSNITHPERSGNIETMTIRYLQSMVSKCIILGHAPAEMIELFGYNPVIEIDYANPVKQIETILENYTEYEELIERNYNEVINNHTWKCRWEQIKSLYAANSKSQ